ncbi:MAG: tetratricopeptide repeat protein, partial [Alphaproteobacteria bacterium]
MKPRYFASLAILGFLAALAPAQRGLACDLTCSNNVYYGWRAYQSDNHAEALKYWRDSAAQGSGEAMHGIGTLHLEGKAVPRDMRAAADWFRKGAEAGYWAAKIDYARQLILGDAIEQDIASAALWLRRSVFENGVVNGTVALDQASADIHHEYDSDKYLCWRHPSRIERFTDFVRELVPQNNARNSAEAFGKGDGLLGGRKHVYYFRSTAQTEAYLLHNGATKCGLYEWNPNRKPSSRAVEAHYVDLGWVRRALKAAIILEPAEEIYWIDYARAWAISSLEFPRNLRLATDAWEHVWAMLAGQDPQLRQARLRRLREEFGFSLDRSVLAEIAELHLRQANFDAAFFFASQIYDDWIDGAITEEMDNLAAATGIARGGVPGLEDAKQMVEAVRNRDGRRASWSNAVDREDRHFPWQEFCGTRGRPSEKSIMLVDAMQQLASAASKAGNVYAKYELYQMVRLGQNIRQDAQDYIDYFQNYTCDPDKRIPDFDEVGAYIDDARAAMPIPKLSRVGTLLLAQGEAAADAGNFESARRAYQDLVNSYEPWYPPAYFNRA